MTQKRLRILGLGLYPNKLVTLLTSILELRQVLERLACAIVARERSHGDLAVDDGEVLDFIEVSWSLIQILHLS